MTNYYRIMLGRNSIHAPECFAGNFIGAGYGIAQDLTSKLPEEWRAFNREFIPVYLQLNPGKTRVAAGLACGMLWTVCKGLNIGDVVLCPDGAGHYHVGEVSGDYQYQPGAILPHRRPVQWLTQAIDRAAMSDELQRSTRSTGTVSRITNYQEEIERLLGRIAPPPPPPAEIIEDPAAFALEKHLEDFLVQNWSHTDLGKQFDIYTVDGEQVGQQYATDTGPIDILAIGKGNKRTLLVVELKRGRASDVVVGQVMRYMGYVKEELAEPGQEVKGVIIAQQDDQKIRRALSVAPNVEFYRYQVTFKLVRA